MKMQNPFRVNLRYLPELERKWRAKYEEACKTVLVIGCLWCGKGGHSHTTLGKVTLKKEGQPDRASYACAPCLIERVKAQEDK